MQVFLIGFMGSGKSHTGRALAQRLGHPFIDLDEYIEAQEGMAIAQLFAQRGEAGFRQLEGQRLRELGGQSKAIISCGGGTPCFLDNMEWMNGQGLTIYLRTPPELLAQRLEHGRAERPLLQGLEGEGLLAFIRQKLAEREACYEQASLIYEQRGLQEDVAGALRHQFKNIIGH